MDARAGLTNFFIFTGVLVQTVSAVAGPSASPTPYESVRAYLQSIVKEYPEQAKMIEIGMNDKGQAIEGIAIGNGPVKNLVVATHHGNEYSGTEVAKAFATSLAIAPIQGQTLQIIPVLNIDGYNRRTRWEYANGAAHDSNRDYPGPCGSEGPFNLRSTAALAKWIEQEGIVASATLHSHSPAVVYPWGISSHDLSTPYDDLFRSLVEAATVESQYPTGNSTDLIYAADGTYEDYAYWKLGVWSILFELGYTHSPDKEAVAELVRVNVPGLRRMFQQAPRQRAENHAFTGSCDVRLKAFDRHDE